MIALLLSVVVASVLGSLHCVGMCGPFATMAATRPDRVRLPVQGAMQAAAAYNGGRLLVYVLLGAAAGSIGSALDTTGAWVGVQRLAAAVGGATMILIGVLGLLRAAGVLGAGRGRITDVAARWAGRAMGTASRGGPKRRAAILGAATGLMPCGWLWAFVLTAAATASPAMGAATMAAFWLGSVPALMAITVGAQLLGAHMRHRHVRRWGRLVRWLMPLLIVAVGVFTVTSRLGVRLPVVDAARNADATGGASPATKIPSPAGAPCH